MGIPSVQDLGALTITPVKVPVMQDLPSCWKELVGLFPPQKAQYKHGVHTPFLKGLAECLKVGSEGSTWSLHQSSCIKEEQNISACLLLLLPLLQWAQKKGELKAGSHHHFCNASQWPISQMSQKAQSPDSEDRIQ